MGMDKQDIKQAAIGLPVLLSVPDGTRCICY